LKYSEGQPINSFEGLSQLGKEHFQNLFKYQKRPSIVEILRISEFFPNFVDEEEN
jgi:hypothetical protein